MNARLTLPILSWSLALSCANDVVLGEHVATRTETNEFTTTASESSETSASSTDGHPSGPPFPDGNDDGRPHDKNNDNDKWGRDSGAPFDGSPFDGGWPPIPQYPGEGEPLEPSLINSGERPPGEPPPDFTTENFDPSMDQGDSVDDGFSE